MSRKVKYYNINNVEISDLSSEGKGIVKIDGKVIFVEGAIAGDIVDIQSKKSNKSFEEGKIRSFIKKSDLRIDPYCQHYNKCGGCKTQHLSYENQLKWKEKVVKDALQRIGGFKDLTILPIIGCEETRYYRNKLDYAVSNKRWLSTQEIETNEAINREGIGFHLAGLYDKVLDVYECFHMPEIHNEIRNFVRERSLGLGISFYDINKKTGCLRNILIRNNVKNEWMICIQIGEMHDQFLPLLQEIKEQFSQIISLQYILNTKTNDTIYDLTPIVYSGQDFIYEYLKEKKFKITPKSFFQTNTAQCVTLYDLIGNLAKIDSGDVVYDLYCGVGSIGIYLAEKASKVVGVELIEEAIVDARMNAKINGLENCHYFAADLKDIFSKEFIDKNGSPSIIITDPPRAGMHPSVVQELCNSQCPTIVYVSCNPQTMANDLKALSEVYTIEKIQPVDMFPNTIHIEAITLLKKK
jgi:23S rRNA (uracil1939-C5)-methyltransferase